MKECCGKQTALFGKRITTIENQPEDIHVLKSCWFECKLCGKRGEEFGPSLVMGNKILSFDPTSSETNQEQPTQK